MTGCYKIARCKLASVYFAWQEPQGRAAGVERAEQFLTKLKSVLRLLGAGDDVEPLKPTRQTWNTWKTRPDDDRVTVRHELCIAIKAVTGQDVTPDQCLSDEHNFSKLVTIVGTPSAHRVSNCPDGEGRDTYDVTVERIAFRRSGPIRIEKHMVRSSEPRGTDIGSALLGLRSARLELSADGAIEPKATELHPGSDGPLSSVGLSLVDDPQHPGVWTVMPNKDTLEGSLYLAGLAHARSAEEGEILIAVSADESAIDADFRPSGVTLETDANKSEARKYLLDKVLALDVTERGRTLMLSRAGVRK